MTERAGPLAGLRVLDLTRLLPGPVATMHLADLGAEVLKIEPPTGTPARRLPPFVAGLAGSPNNHSPGWIRG